MSNIRLNVPEGYTVCDGKQISFRAPCVGSSIESIVIGEDAFTLVDTKGVAVTLSGDACFSSGSMVHAILDVTNSRAYLQTSVAPKIKIVRW